MELREPLAPATKAFLVAVLVVPVVLIVVHANDVGDHQVPFPAASAAGANRLTVAGPCLPAGRLDIAVREDARTVTVTVTALDYDPDNTDDRAMDPEVHLAAPLGDRRLIDGATGNDVPVE